VGVGQQYNLIRVVRRNRVPDERTEQTYDGYDVAASRPRVFEWHKRSREGRCQEVEQAVSYIVRFDVKICDYD